MKKVLCILLALLMLFAVACGTIQKQTNEQEQGQEQQPPIEYKFYSSAVAAGGIDAEIDGESIENDKNKVAFFRADTLRFLGGRKSYKKTEELGKTIEFSISGKEYTLEYLQTGTRKFSVQDTYSQNYGEYDIYYYEYGFPGKISVDIYSKTGRLAEYYDTGAKATEGNFTEEQALNKATALIHEIYGEDSLNGYTLKTYHDEDDVTVDAERDFGDYKTEDRIRIKYSLSGKLWMINAKDFHSMDCWEDDITAEMVENARTALVSNLLSRGYNVHEEYLTLLYDFNSGKFFLEAYASYPLDEKEKEDPLRLPNVWHFYVNVN